MRNFLKWIGILCFTGIFIFLAFNRHSNSGYFTYHSEIWSDKAGYYVYLPAALKFDFNPQNFPDSIDTKTGGGFFLDFDNNKIRTKYTYGVALLQIPFFLLADALAKPLGYNQNGFSPIYHWSINVASVFYLMLGLLFLTAFLKTYFSTNKIYLVVLSVFLATNLFYYSLDETGMSHVYSFSLFSIFLYLLRRTNYLAEHTVFKVFSFGILCGLIVLVRPTNILFLSTFLFLDIKNVDEILIRLKRLVDLRSIFPVVLGLTIVIIPQLIYWKYSEGSFLKYSYGKEGFNWSNPKILHTWFSPNNGLFLYTPFFFLILGCLFSMLKDKMKNGVYLITFFFVLSYVLSTWWDWSFGCSFGSRSYVEYLALFSLPFAYVATSITLKNKIKFISFWFLILILIGFNLKLIYSYDGCYYGQSNWDWHEYINLVISPTK